MMDIRNCIRVLVLCGAFAALQPTFSWAQPDVDNAAKTENPPNWERGANRGMGGRGGNRALGGRNNLTPEQRQQQVKQLLTRAGVTDAKDQDAIAAFVLENETALQTLRTKWDALSVAMRDNTTSDKQLAGLLNDFRNAMDDEKARRLKAQQALNAKIGLDKKPRLETQLMMSGLLGDDAALMQSGSMGRFGGGAGFGAGGFGGRGMRGGF